jgi:DegV family protein with EDD domain
MGEMMRKYTIVTESGADLSRELIEQYHIDVLPMHLAINNKDYLDGEVSVEELVDSYHRTKETPKTSAVNPYQYLEAFERIRAEDPDTIIIHIGYSAQTTSSFQNALIAAEGMSNIYHIDSCNVSMGQAFLIKQVAELIEKSPDITPDELVSRIAEYAKQTRFHFVPGDLTYLRAGGRVSNAQFLGAKLLKLKPLIELQDGLLVTKDRYKGSMESIARDLVKKFFAKFNINKDEVYLGYVHSISESVKASMEHHVKEAGVKKIVWLKAGCVITSHSGPYGIGIAGLEI